MLPRREAGSNILVVTKSEQFKMQVAGSLENQGFEAGNTIIAELPHGVDFGSLTQYTKESATVHVVDQFYLARNILTRPLRHAGRHIDVNAVFLESNPAIDKDISKSNFTLGLLALKAGNQPLAPSVHCVGYDSSTMKELMVDYVGNHIGWHFKPWVETRIHATDRLSIGEDVIKMSDPSFLPARHSSYTTTDAFVFVPRPL